MIGASKINQESDDLIRLQEMFDLGLNNSEIHRIYRTNGGHQLSRIHISSIRRNKRWNSDTRSFLMKSELGGTFVVTTELENTIYKTVIGVIMTDTSKLYIYLTYKNEILQSGNTSYPMTIQPTTEDLMRFHNDWIYNDVSNC